jgi:chromosome segregation ATPase
MIDLSKFPTTVSHLHTTDLVAIMQHACEMAIKSIDAPETLVSRERDGYRDQLVLERKSMDKYVARIARQDEEIKNQAKIIQQKDDEIAVQVNAIDGLHHRLRASEENNEALRQLNAKAKAVILDKEEMIAQAPPENLSSLPNMEYRLKELQRLIAARNDEINERHTEEKRLSDIISQLHLKINALEGEKSTLKHQLNEYYTSIGKWQQEVTRITNERNTEYNLRQRTGTELEQARADKHSLQKQLQDKARHCEDADKQIARQQELIRELREKRLPIPTGPGIERMAVREFSHIMLQRLMANTHKGGWSTTLNAVLLGRLIKNAGEIGVALSNGDIDSDEFRGICADVANYAMMICDNQEGFQ